jgi:hypothetical protein
VGTASPFGVTTINSCPSGTSSFGSASELPCETRKGTLGLGGNRSVGMKSCENDADRRPFPLQNARIPQSFPGFALGKISESRHSIAAFRMKTYPHENCKGVDICRHHARLPPPQERRIDDYGHGRVIDNCIADTAVFFAYFAIGLHCPPQVMKALALRTWWRDVSITSEGSLCLTSHLTSCQIYHKFSYTTWIRCAWLGLE